MINQRAVEDDRAALRPDAVLPLGHAERPARREHQREQRRTAAAGSRCRRRATSAASQGTPLPRLPGVLERDVSDKPEIVSGQPRIEPARRAVIRHRYECRIETLPAVDRGVGADRRRAAQVGRARRHDPRLQLRQRHLPGPAPAPGRARASPTRRPRTCRSRSGCRRSTPAARAPPATIDEMTANIDYAPTFLDWAGSQSCPEVGDCRVMDGRSWLPLFDPTEGSFPADRPLATELDLNNDSVQPGRGISCAYRGRARRAATCSSATRRSPTCATGTCEPTDVRELYDHLQRPVRAPEPAAGAAGLARGEQLESRLSHAQRRAARLRRDRGPRPRARERPVLRLAAAAR